MTSTRPTGDAAPHRTGPQRFQQPVTAQPRPDVVGAVASALLLLVLVVGVPAALLWLDGVPQLPTSLPTREQLTASIGLDQVLSVLVWVVWLAWLQFTVCVLVELASALSGVGLPARVPLAGPSQRFARTLVASVLLLVTAAGPATALSHEASGPPEAGPVAVTSTVDGSTQAQVASEDEAGDASSQETTVVSEQGEVTYQLGDMVLSPEEGAELVGKKVYVVQPPEGRYHDNLWDIAERELGDGRRYKEIYELNKGREQPDGHELSLARLIYPNWLLVVPEDAAGAERVVAVATPDPAQQSGPATDAGEPSAPQESSGAAGTAASDPVSTTSAADLADDDVAEGAGLEAQGLLGAGLLAAGLLAAVEQVRRRRRTPEPSDEAVEVEVALRVGADPQRAWLLDRGLRGLAEAVRGGGGDLPGVYAAVVDDDGLTLRLAPPVPDAPGPWVAHEEGRVWRLDAAAVDRGGRGGLAPFPGLVSIGRDADGADVLVDLEAAQGPVAVVGDEGASLEVATALAAELATNRWSDRLRVTGVDLPASLTCLGPDRYRAVGTLDDALPALEDRRSDQLGAGVLTGRMRGSGASAWMPEYLVLGRAPQGAEAERLTRLAATDQRSPLGVVCVGDLPGARWRVEVAADGSLAIQVLGLQVQGNRLPAQQVASVAELLTPDAEVEGIDEQRAAVEHEGAVDRPEVSAPPRTLDPADLSAAPVRVHVLGGPRVFTQRPIDEARLELATELVVHLALHPDGVHPTVLAAALWPRGVTAAVRETTIERAVEWLGTDGAGQPHLQRTSDGRLSLGPGVVLDWDVVRSLLARSRVATGVAQERAFLADALRLAQGHVHAAERPGGRYAWLARVRLERASRALLVDAAHRLAILSWDGDDPTGAKEAAWSGLQVAPTEELLWRDLLRAAAATGGTAAVQDVAADLEATLHTAGIAEMAAPTAALLEELMPTAAVGRGSAVGPA